MTDAPKTVGPVPETGTCGVGGVVGVGVGAAVIGVGVGQTQLGEVEQDGFRQALATHAMPD